MVKKALEIIAKIADAIEKQWDEIIEEKIKYQYGIITKISSAHMENGVYEELQRRYTEAGWELHARNNLDSLDTVKNGPSHIITFSLLKNNKLIKEQNL